LVVVALEHLQQQAQVSKDHLLHCQVHHHLPQLHLLVVALVVAVVLAEKQVDLVDLVVVDLNGVQVEQEILHQHRQHKEIMAEQEQELLVMDLMLTVVVAAALARLVALVLLDLLVKVEMAEMEPHLLFLEYLQLTQVEVEVEETQNQEAQAELVVVE